MSPNLGQPPQCLGLVPSPDGGDDLVGIGGPDEGLRVNVRFAQEAADRGLEVNNRAEHAAFEAALAQFGKEALDGVEPGA